MLASLPLTGDEENKEEHDGRMVTLVVIVDEEFSRRIENSGHPDFVAEVEEDASTENEPGELPISLYNPNGSLDTQAFTIDLSDDKELTGMPEEDNKV